MKTIKLKNKRDIHLLLILLIAWLGINCVTSWFYYQEYSYSIDVVAQMVADSEQEKIDTAADILKNNSMKSVSQGKQILKDYGYLEHGENALYHRFLYQSTVTAAITFLMFIITTLLLLKWKASVIQEQHALLLKIENVITNFRENNFEVYLQISEDDEQEKIKYQLDALDNYLKLLKEEAWLEKEGMKELVSDISHQLKTPVAALDACFSVLLHENLSDDERKEFSARCRSALDGLEMLLQSLLQISKMEAGLIQIEKKKAVLLDTITMAVNRVYQKASGKNIEFDFDYEGLLENLTIMHDAKWLGEAIINVLDNAIKYSPDYSKIFLRIQKRIGFVRIEIEDQGFGIPKEEYHKIFQRFYRGSLPEVKEQSGSGIGLFLAREIIEKHNGTITVSSRQFAKNDTNNRHGSTFVIQLPDNE